MSHLSRRARGKALTLLVLVVAVAGMALGAGAVGAQTQPDGQLTIAFRAVPEFAGELGLDPQQGFEVHELRRAMRISPDGRNIPQVIVALTQSRAIEANQADGTPGYVFRGGSTLVVDLSIPEIKYRIFKNIASKSRQDRTAAFIRDAAADPLRALFLMPERPEPFAALHALADDGV